MKNRYLIRAVKYFLFLIVLFVILFAVLLATGYSSWDTFLRVWTSDRAWLMIAVFVGLPLAYPLFGYVSREVRGNLADNYETIERVAHMNGYLIKERTPERVVCGVSGLRRLALLFEDRIEITADGNYFRIQGPRKEVVRFVYRFETFR